MEPPYCYSSVEELKKNQTRYNQYNIFHILERLHLLAAQGVDTSIDPLDTSTTAYKLYKDFEVPPLPPRYQHLQLPAYWLIHMHARKETKRFHTKTTGALIPFKELAQKIAVGYKTLDANTKSWLDDVNDKLLAYNMEMRDEWREWNFLVKRETSMKGDTMHSVVAAAAALKTRQVYSHMERMPTQQALPPLISSIDEELRQLRNMRSSLPIPSHRIAPSNIRLSANERMRELQLLHSRNDSMPSVSNADVSEKIRRLQRIHAAELSLKIQALRNGTIPPARMPSTSAEDRELARLENEIRSRQGMMMPSSYSETPSLFVRAASSSLPVARSFSTVLNHTHRLKRLSETSTGESTSESSCLNAKRAKLHHLMTPSQEMRSRADPASAAANYMARLRRTSMPPEDSTPVSTLPIRRASLPAESSSFAEEFPSPPFGGRVLRGHGRGLAVFGSSLSSSHPSPMFGSSTHPTGRFGNREESEEQYKQLVLGYQLGLDAAARAGVSLSTSHRRGRDTSSVRASDCTISEFGLSYSEIMDTLNEMERKG